LLLAGPPHSALGGVATHVRGLTTCLTSVGVQVDVLEIGSHAWNGGLQRVFGTVRALRRIQSANGPVYFNPSFDHASIIRDGLLASAAHYAGRRVVIHFHGGLPNDVLSRGVAASWFRTVLRRAELLFVLNREQQRQLEDLELPASIMDYVVPIPPTPSVVIRDRARTVLFLSRLAADKGILDLIDAIGMLRTTMPDIRLLVGGDGPLRVVSLARARDRGVDLEYLGTLRGEAILNAHARADVFALPTYHAEGFPLAALEAMASGLPMICSPQGAIPDRLTDGTHAIFVPPRQPDVLAEGLARLLHDASLRQSMQLAARDYATANHSCAVLGPRYKARLATL